MRKVQILIGLFLCISVGIYAQSTAEKNCSELKKMRTELNNHFNKKMYPTLKKEHGKLMSKLSKKDKSTLANLRKLQEEVNKERKKMGEAAARAKKSGKDMKAFHESTKEQAMATRKKQESINNQLKPIVDRNKTAIMTTDKAIATKDKKWRSERKTIRNKYKDAECVKTAQRMNRKMRGQQQMRPPRDGKKPERRQPQGRKPNGKKPQNGKEGRSPQGKSKRQQAGLFLIWDANQKSMPQSLGSTQDATPIERKWQDTAGTE